jgi:hypothetical protein
MKWAISKNSCPSCGGKIMNDSDLYEIKKIKSDIEGLNSVSSIRSSISSDDTHTDAFESMINDLSMLFLFSIKKVVKNNLIQENKFNTRFTEADDSPDDVNSDYGEESFEARVRRQVEEELGIGVSSEDSYSGDNNEDDDPDEDDRVERLKKIHKKAQGSILKKVNKPITRIS